MAALITREMLNSRSTADGGNIKSEMYIRDVDEFIPYIERDDTPLIKLIGTGGSADKLKYEHGQGYLTPSTVVIETTNPGTGATQITVDNPQYLQQWDVLRSPLTNGELLQVTDANPVNPVNVRRAYGGGSADNLAIGDSIKVLGPAVPEGVDTPSSPMTQGDLDWDTFQIFEYSWSITHRGKVTPSYEYKTNRFKEQLKKAMVEAALDLENFALFGKRYLPANSTDATMTRGLLEATTSNLSDLNGDPVTLMDFLDLEQTKFMDVGPSEMGKTVVLGMFEKRIVNSWFNPTRRSTVTDAKLRVTWDEIETDFGTYKFVIHHNHPSGRMTTINTNDVKRMTYEGGNWQTGMFSTQGWYDRGFLRGDFGFIWPVARRRSALYDFSVNPSDYGDLENNLGNAA